ncbi:DNA cytosine methyltransferase [Bosea sp. (in: a-proteobacteria)]|uniref:DNA cytosine methyltransferase n=1 Tax=Bosea sp. (in: a-proteobacteria) TaxID=1871050 RepID=UPI003B3A4219
MRELIVDSFAGGGGASTGIELALGRSPDIAINHDAEALALHRMNHPETLHLPHNVWKVDPVAVTGGRPVGLLWASPDCKHFSKAKGGKPVKRNIRDLAWVVVRWARQVRPRVIILENVEEFRDWGPISAEGVPCKERKGETFQRWAGELKRLGYRVEHRELRACDYGAPTIRKRLFLIARRDGERIVWPKATHGRPDDPDVIAGRKLPWRTAASIIDWTLPCHSIFLTREEGRAVGVNRPLAEATMARIGRGVKRYVIDAAKPFVVRTDMASAAARNGVHATDEPIQTMTTGGSFALAAPVVAPAPAYFCEPCGQGFDDSFADGIGGLAPAECPRCGEERLLAPFVTKFRANSTGSPLAEPLHTVTANGENRERPGGCAPLGLVSPVLVGCGGRAGQSRPRSADEPCATGTAKADVCLVAPVLTYAQQGGLNRSPEEPHSTICASPKDQNALLAVHMSRQFGASIGSDADEPVGTVTAGGGGKTALVAAHLQAYYGEGAGGADRSAAAEDPVRTVVTENRHAVVAAFMAQHNTEHVGVKPGRPVDEPVATITASGGQAALTAAFLAQHNTGVVGHPLDKPVSTLTAGGAFGAPQQALVEASFLSHHYTSNTRGGAGDPRDPLKTVTAGGWHAAEVRAFLMKYYGPAIGQDAQDPLHTATAKARFGLVTVEIGGEPYVIADIGMRMLSPRELFRAQGFPDSYIIDRGLKVEVREGWGEDDGPAEPIAITKTAQVRMCGNSVCPPLAQALVAANFQPRESERAKPAAALPLFLEAAE